MDTDLASRDANTALDNVLTKIQMKARGLKPTPDTVPVQDMWQQVPEKTIDAGYMKMQGLGTDEEYAYMQVKIDPNSRSVIHLHERMVEKFFLMKGKLCFKVGTDPELSKPIRKGCLEDVGESETIYPGEWHLVLTSEIETYVLILYKPSL